MGGGTVVKWRGGGIICPTSRVGIRLICQPKLGEVQSPCPHTHMSAHMCCAEALSFERRAIPCISLRLQYGSLVFTRIAELSVIGRRELLRQLIYYESITLESNGQVCLTSD